MTTGRDDKMINPATASPSQACTSRCAPVTSRVLSRIYRSGLLWATVAGPIMTCVMSVFVQPHVPSALSGLAGTIVAVAFMACGREVHLLNRSDSWLLGVGLFIIQIGALGCLGVLVIECHTGLRPVPCASAMIGASLAWIVGVVVAGRQPQRIYEDPEDPTRAASRRTGGGLR